jgi:hypothetical protein
MVATLPPRKQPMAKHARTLRIWTTTVGAAIAAVTAGLVASPAAQAATPCWQRVLDQWGTGAVRQAYSQACYRAALNHLPFDMRAYTTAEQDIKSAMLAATRRRAGGAPGPSESPHLSRGGSGVAGAQATRLLQSSRADRVAARATLAAETGVPVPLRVWLALGFAVALVAAAAVRTLQGRLATRRALRNRFRDGDDRR